MKINNLHYILIFCLVAIIAIIFAPEIFNYYNLSDGILEGLFGIKEKTTLLKILALFIDYGLIIVVYFVGLTLAEAMLNSQIALVCLSIYLFFAGFKLYHLAIFDPNWGPDDLGAHITVYAVGSMMVFAGIACLSYAKKLTQMKDRKCTPPL
ncbi:MAG: hypothetical protein WC604_05095 [Candidatus Gracilibacteria bacterium]